MTDIQKYVKYEEGTVG